MTELESLIEEQKKDAMRDGIVLGDCVTTRNKSPKVVQYNFKSVVRYNNERTLNILLARMFGNSVNVDVLINIAEKTDNVRELHEDLCRIIDYSRAISSILFSTKDCSFESCYAPELRLDTIRELLYSTTE